MGYSLVWDGDDGAPAESIEVFLKDIVSDCQEVEEKYLRKSAQVMKEKIIENLNHIKRTSINLPEGHQHMANDVIYRIVSDEFGNRVARIRGGMKTGTLWHIVNDGTYRTDATHFLDASLQNSEYMIERILDSELEESDF